MTSGRRGQPAGAPTDWQDRGPAGVPAAERAAKEDEGPAAEANSGGDGAKPTDTVDNAPIDALLDDVKRERDEYLELAQRAQADLDNYRKRAAQQAADAERKAKTSLAKDVLPALDNLERALESAPADDPLADGVRLVSRELAEALRKAGVESFDPTGEKFDPNVSEALSSQPGDGTEPGTVLQTLSRGYRLGDHVIRPARVVVAE